MNPLINKRVQAILVGLNERQTALVHRAQELCASTPEFIQLEDSIEAFCNAHNGSMEYVYDGLGLEFHFKGDQNFFCALIAWCKENKIWLPGEHGKETVSANYPQSKFYALRFDNPNYPYALYYLRFTLVFDERCSNYATEELNFGLFSSSLEDLSPPQPEEIKVTPVENEETAPIEPHTVH